MENILDEILSNLEVYAGDVLSHYGMPRRSGRYPYGSGDDPYQHGYHDFIAKVDLMRKEGKDKYTDPNTGKVYTGDAALAKQLNLSPKEFRIEYSLCSNERKSLNIASAKSMSKHGMNPTEIGRKMGVNESTVRSWLNNTNQDKKNEKTKQIRDFLKERVDADKMVDIGQGTERELGVSKEKFNEAVYLLKRDGYVEYSGGVPYNTNTGKQLTQRVLCVPGTEHKEIYDYEKVKPLNEYTSHDGGMTFDKFQYPASMDSSRIFVRYAEDGGTLKDGVIELRRNVPDLDLGNARYSQVRILVDDNKYAKGMAIYSDDIPDGYDMVINSNKPRAKGLDGALKDIKNDPDNPFGSNIKANGQSYYDDPVTGERKLSLINKRADEGDWSDWQDTVPSQFLSKQPYKLAKQQLDLTKAEAKEEFERIKALDQPTVRKYYLEKFAESSDAAAVHLKAAALPGQKYHVIFPINSLKDTEVYAPKYENGTELALIRYPHEGTFEIPIVTVNNKHAEAKKILGPDITDAIGINHNVAERLSGADFDGDAVMAIPTNDPNGRVSIKSTPKLKGLEGFDNKELYQYDKKIPASESSDGEDHYFRDGKEFRVMKNTGTQMGMISNLITDMTLAGASSDELARATKHAMVVIDAEKHKLDYKQSELDNNIAELRQNYLRRVDEDGTVHIGSGASTLISRAKGQKTVDKRQGSPKINVKDDPDYDPTKPEGALIWKKADNRWYPERTYDKDTKEVTITTADNKKIKYSMDDQEAVRKYKPQKVVDDNTGDVWFENEDGTIKYKTRTRTQRTTNMEDTTDAYTLLSEKRYPMEVLYADHANYMKDLANKARLELLNTEKTAYNAAARTEYDDEYRSLKNKVDNASLNSPKIREAERRANVEVAKKIAADPDAKDEDIKKWHQQAIEKTRNEVGAIKRRDRYIEITDREWDAIKKGAISENMLKRILNNTDPDALRERAMPKQSKDLKASEKNLIKAMSASNYTIAEIAKRLGRSTSSVEKYLTGRRNGK